MLSAILFIVGAYLIASIPTGYWACKVIKGIDIREYGSKSTGATNVWRVCGKTMGLSVFAFDVLKGLAPTAYAHYLSSGPWSTEWSFAPNVVPAVVAFAALFGHSRSIFLKFQGGKSAATGLGTLLGLSPMGGFLTFATWVLVVLTTRYVGFSSVLAVFLSGLYFWLYGAPVPSICFCVAGFLFVAYRHKANFGRMMKGTEPKLGERPKEPEQKQEQESSLPGA